MRTQVNAHCPGTYHSTAEGGLAEGANVNKTIGTTE